MKKIFLNGDIVTMDPSVTAEAICIDGAKICALGTADDLCAQYADAKIVDLKGGALLPGFIDAHSHITAFADTLVLAQLGSANSIDCLIELLKNYLEDEPPSDGAWLLGFGYDHNRLAEGRHPTREELDSISDEIPIMVTHASGHMGALNTPALRAMGITEETPDPEGGRIGHNEDGSLTGYLEETAFTTQTGKIPPPTKDARLKALSRAQQKYLSYGITTVQDGLVRDAQFELLSEFANAHQFILDVVGYADLKQSKNLLQPDKSFDHFRMGGYKIFLDGSPQGRTAWLSKPYEGAEDGYCGYPVYQDTEVLDFVKCALQERAQLLVHCNGDAAAQQMLNAYKACGGSDETRPVMIHAQLLRPDQMQQMKQFGIIASFFVAHTYFWGDVHRKNLGTRAEEISPVRSALDEGLVYTFHQDTPVIEPDMLKTIWCAVSRRTQSGDTLGADQRISVFDALRAITVNAAYQYFEEHDKGTLAVGKRADLVVLDRNPLRVEPDEITKIQVLKTIKDGTLVYQK